MRRLNPATGKRFVNGYIREDGYKFQNYMTSRINKKDGYFVERWISPKAQKDIKERLLKAKKRINPKTRNIFKKGDIREDGYIFVEYQFTLPPRLDGYFKEQWCSKERWENERKNRNNNPSGIGKRSKNPLTGKQWKKGEVREDGLIFCSVSKLRTNKEGFYKDNFSSPSAYHRRHVIHTLGHIKKRVEKKSLKLSVDADYLISIYPEDSLCPILGMKLEWGGDRANSPSLDRIIPEKGYVEGNVMWLSDKANTMKSNASQDELKKFANWALENL